MKTRFLFILTIFLISACLDDQVKQDNPLQLPEVLNNVKFGDIQLPNGTIAKRLPGTSNAVEFIFPRGIQYVGLDKESKQVLRIGSGCYECTSTCTKGCDVVKLGEQVGCSRCEDKATCSGKDCSSMGQMEQAGFIDLNSGIKLISKETFSSQEFLKPPSLEVLNKIPEVRDALEKFYTEYWGAEIPSSKNSKSVVVSFFGAKANLFIPTDMISNARINQTYYMIDDGNEVKCSCESGSSGCTLKEIKANVWPYPVIGQSCESGSCNSCRMTW